MERELKHSEDLRVLKSQFDAKNEVEKFVSKIETNMNALGTK